MTPRVDRCHENATVYIKYQMEQKLSDPETVAFLAILNQTIAELLELAAMKIARHYPADTGS